MGVNLRRTNIRMPKQLLNYAQVGALLQQVGRKAMPQHMGSDVIAKSSSANTLLDAQPHREGGKRSAAFGQKNVSRRTRPHQPRTSRFQIPFHHYDSFASDWSHTLLISLTDYVDKSRFKVQLFQS